MAKSTKHTINEIKSIENLAPYFGYPISQAAKQLNICATLFKKKCRSLGIARWPHRKFRALKTYHDAGMPTEIYEQKLKQLSENPNLSLAVLIPKAERTFEINASQSAPSQDLVEQIIDITTVDLLFDLLNAKPNCPTDDATSCTPTYTPLITKSQDQTDEFVSASSTFSPSQIINIKSGSSHTVSCKK